MICIKVTKKRDDIIKVVCDGHANFGAHGEDIVCASVSSIVQTAVLGLFNVAQTKLDFKIDEKKGFLSLELPVEISETENDKSQIILKTMFMGLENLFESYSDFIELEVE